jgi:hypothetical protein
VALTPESSPTAVTLLPVVNMRDRAIPSPAENEPLLNTFSCPYLFLLYKLRYINAKHQYGVTPLSIDG